jgi:hypothetical protein
VQHTEQLRELAGEYDTGLSDTYRSFEAYVNHPNRQEYERIAEELLEMADLTPVS